MERYRGNLSKMYMRDYVVGMERYEKELEVRGKISYLWG